MNPRLTAVTIHRWTGLTIGLVLLISALTGAGMAFRPSLDPVVYPAQFHGSDCATPLPLDALLAAAMAKHPSGAADYIRLRGGPSTPAMVRFGNKDTLFVDRCTGEVKASQNRYQGVFGVLEWVHRLIFIPGGGLVVGTSALAALLIMAGLGVYIWWPRKPRRFTQGWVIDRRLKGPMFTLGLHKTIGAWAVILLAISAATALPNAFDGLKAMMIGEQERPHSTPPVPKARKAPIEGAMAVVRTLTPGPREVLIHLARKGKDPVEAFVIEARAPHSNARSYLYLDAYSDKVLKFTPYSQMGFWGRVYYWMLSVHTGEVGGVIGQFLLFLGAVSVPVLCYTGASSYLRRRFRKPSARRVAAT